MERIGQRRPLDDDYFSYLSGLNDFPLYFCPTFVIFGRSRRF